MEGMQALTVGLTLFVLCKVSRLWQWGSLSLCYGRYAGFDSGADTHCVMEGMQALTVGLTLIVLCKVSRL